MEYRFIHSLFLLYIVARIVQGTNDSNHSSTLLTESLNDNCPPWYFYNTTSEGCECFSNPSTDGVVQCTEKGALLSFGNCMTFDEDKGFSIGRCSYFTLSKYDLSTKGSYISLPKSVSKLNDYMCAPLNRKGEMCSQCMDGYGPSVTSMRYECKKCPKLYWLYLLGYFILECALVTVLFFVILFLRINLTSAPMMSFVLYSQFQGFLYSYINKWYVLDERISIYWKILMVFYGIFNLDFGRYIFPAFCASPHLKPFHITYLYYIPLIYLLFLTSIAWLCIRKFNKPTAFVLQSMSDSKNSMIDVFASFSLLSYAKLMFISIGTALRPVVTWNANNFSVQSHHRLFSEPNVEYINKEYLPLIIFSSIVTLFTVIFPILLAVYPIRSFRSLFFKYRFTSRHMGAINMFLDKFYSCFRDGINGGRDMRSFVSIYYFIYWLVFVFTIVQELFRLFHVNLGAMTFTIFGFLVAIAQPYKTTLMNVSDTLILANLALFYILLSQSVNYYYLSTFYWIMICILNTIPPLVLIVTIIFKTFKKFKIFKLHNMFRKLKKSSCCLFQKNITSRPDMERLQESVTSLASDSATKTPDRVLHPEWYNAENIHYGSTEQSQCHSETQNQDIVVYS